MTQCFIAYLQGLVNCFTEKLLIWQIFNFLVARPEVKKVFVVSPQMNSTCIIGDNIAMLGIFKSKRKIVHCYLANKFLLNLYVMINFKFICCDQFQSVLLRHLINYNPFKHRAGHLGFMFLHSTSKFYFQDLLTLRIIFSYLWTRPIEI